MSEPENPLRYFTLALTAAAFLIAGALMTCWSESRDSGVHSITIGLLFTILFRQEPMK